MFLFHWPLVGSSVFRYTITGWRATVSWIVPFSGAPAAGSWAVIVPSSAPTESTVVTLTDSGRIFSASVSFLPTRSGAVVMGGAVVVGTPSVVGTGAPGAAGVAGAVGLGRGVADVDDAVASLIASTPPASSSTAIRATVSRRRPRLRATVPPWFGPVAAPPGEPATGWVVGVCAMGLPAGGESSRRATGWP